MLSLRNLKSDDAGLYNCSAVNSEGRDSKQVEVHVIGELQFLNPTIKLFQSKCCAETGDQRYSRHTP